MKKRWPDLLNIIVVVIFFIAGLALVNGTTVFGENKTDVLPVWEFYLIFAATIIPALFLFIFNILRKAYKPNWVIVGIFAGLFLIDMIVVLTFKNNQTFEVPTLKEVSEGVYAFVGYIAEFTFEITPVMRLSFILQYLVLLLATFFIIDLLPKIFDGEKFISLVALGVLIYASICVIYSYIFEFDSYVNFITHIKDGDLWMYQVKSLYHHKNSYGLILLIGMIASLFLHQQKTNWWWWLIVGSFFYLNIVFVWDKAALGFGAIIFLSYLLCRFFVTYKDNKKRNLITLGVVGGIILLGIIGYVIAGLIDNRVFNIIISSLDTKGYSTLTTRKWVWSKINLILYQCGGLFGAGFRLFSSLLFYYNVLDPINAVPNNHNDAHNGYYELLGSGGIILLAVYLLLVGYFVYICIKNFKEHKTLSFFSLTLIGIMFFYMIIESGTPLFSRTLDYSFLSMIIFVPMLSIHYHNKTKTE